MTVPVPSELEFSTQGDGVTTVFSYPVRFLEPSELVVISRTSAGDNVLTLNSHYTVSGAGNENGGSITMLYVPLSSETIVRYRYTDAKQIVDLQDSQRNPAEAVEQQLDRLTMAIQDRGEKLTDIIDLANETAEGLAQEIQDRIDGDAALASLIGQAGTIAEHFYESNLAASLANIKSTFHSVMTGGGNVPGDGDGGLYIDSDNGSSDTFMSADGRTWYKVGDVSDGRVAAGSGLFNIIKSRRFDVTNPKYGAKFDGVTDDTAAIQAAIDDAKAIGGGDVYLPSDAVGIVHKDGTLTQTGTNPTAFALIIDSDNIRFQARGNGKAILRPKVTNAYSLLYLRKLPIVNGAIDINGGGIYNIEFDGDFDADTAGTIEDGGNALVYAHGLRNYDFESLVFRNSPDYGLGLQNGGFNNVTLRRILVEDVANDAIDVKNNGDTITENKIYDLTMHRFGRATNLTYPFAGLDIMGPGWLVSQVHASDFGDIGSVSAAIRFKQGEAGESRGQGGNYCVLDGFYIYGKSGGDMPAGGVKSSARDVKISNGTIRLCPAEGVLIEQQECQVVAVTARECGTGFKTRDYTYTTNGDRTSFIGCQARSNTAIGFDIETRENTFAGCISRSNDIGLEFSSLAANNRWDGGEISNNLTKPVKNGGSSNRVRNAVGFHTEINLESDPYSVGTVGVVAVTIPHGLSFAPSKSAVSLTPVRGPNVSYSVSPEVIGTDATNIAARVYVNVASDGNTATLIAHVRQLDLPTIV